MGFNKKAVKLHLAKAALLPLVAFAGCSSSPSSTDEPLGGTSTFGVGQASRLGTASNVASTVGDTVVRTTAVILAKYEATAIQRKFAEARARATFQKMPPARKQTLKSKRVRYIAVDTQKDARIKGRKAVMIWDTEAESIVGNQVYDVQEPPAVGATAKFETYASEYIGSGI